MTEREYHAPVIADEAIRRIREADRAMEFLTIAGIEEFRTAAGHKLASEDVETYRTHMLDTAGKLVELAKLAVAAGPSHKERHHLRSPADADPWLYVLSQAEQLTPRRQVT